MLRVPLAAPAGRRPDSEDVHGDPTPDPDDASDFPRPFLSQASDFAESLPEPLAYVDADLAEAAYANKKTQKTLGKKRIKKWVADHVPITKWLLTYDCNTKLRGDVVGGVIIGLILICQTMAHAAIATTMTVQGPYCAIFPAVVYAVFGTSPHASISSGAVAAVMIADQLSKFPDIEVRTRVASFYALTTGFLIFLFGVTKLTFLVRFLSQPTLSGFISGASLIIAATQSKQLTGLDKHLLNEKGVIPIFTGTFVNIKSINWNAVAMGVCVGLALHYSKKLKGSLKKRKESWVGYVVAAFDFKELFAVVITGGIVFFLQTPGDENMSQELLFAVVITGGIVFFLQTPGDENMSQESGLIVNVVGPVPQGVPAFEPPWRYVPDDVTLTSLIPGSVLIALTSFITTFSSSRRVALQQGYSIKASQEAIALGLAGITVKGGINGGFFQTFPVSGSLSRAALLPMLGIHSQIGGLVATAVVAGGLSFCSKAIFWIPKCTLSGIIILACTSLQDFPYLLWLVKTSKILERTKQTATNVVARISSRDSPGVGKESGKPIPGVAPLLQEPLLSAASRESPEITVRQVGGDPRLDRALLVDQEPVEGPDDEENLSPGSTNNPSAVPKRAVMKRVGSYESDILWFQQNGMHKTASAGELTYAGVDHDFAEMSKDFYEHRIKQQPSLGRSQKDLLSPVGVGEIQAASPVSPAVQGGAGKLINGAQEDLIPGSAVVGFYRDILVWILACGGTIVYGVLQGVALSVALSLVIMISDVVFPRVSQVGKLEQHSSLYDIERARKKDIVVHQFEGVVMFAFGNSMFFANIEYVREEVEKMLEKERQWREIRVVILVWNQVNSIDATALKELKELFEAWKKRGLSILAADATGETLDVLEEHFAKFFDQPKVLLTVEECLFQARFRVHGGA